MFKGKKVLVAGGTGFIGINLIKRLLAEGAIVRATLHRKEPVVLNETIAYVKCDLLNPADCQKVVEGIDYVFMCAASTAGAAVMAATPLVHVTPNIVMNAQILEAAYFAKVKKFIWLSSNAAYPPTGDRPVKEEEMFDGDPYETYYGVGWMKRYTELLCKLYSLKLKETMPTVVIRPSNIYGSHDKFDPAASHVMAATLRKVIERQAPIKVWGTGEDIRDLIYIDDFIEAVILATEKINTYDPINIGFGKGYSIKKILQMALEIDGYKEVKVEYDQSKPSMIPVRLIDTTKAEELLGFKPKTDIRTGIAKTIDWYRKNYAGS
ncbi:MAG: NAD-dependent epimerase/dehydratase family protein [bacterium]